jgi:hypothetical protein
MVVEIALGILLALLILVAGVAILVAAGAVLREILPGIPIVGAQWLLIHFLGLWGLGLDLVLTFGIIYLIGRKMERDKTAGKNLPA